MPTAAPLVSEQSVIAPVDAGASGLDLYGFKADGGRTLLLKLAGDQRLPSISPSRTVLQFVSRAADGSWTPYVVRKGEQPVPMFVPRAPRDVTCSDRLAWSPVPGQVALLCSSTRSASRPTTRPPSTDGIPAPLSTTAASPTTVPTGTPKSPRPGRRRP